MNTRVFGVPRADVGIWLLLALGWAVGFLAGNLYHAPVITRHVVTRLTVQQQFGAPDASFAGATVNKGLTGLTCDLWRSKGVLYCHR